MNSHCVFMGHLYVTYALGGAHLSAGVTLYGDRLTDRQRQTETDRVRERCLDLAALNSPFRLNFGHKESVLYGS